MYGTETAISVSEIVNCKPVSLPLPDEPQTNVLATSPNNCVIVHELSLVNDSLAHPVYYISDIHLEHQLNLDGKSLPVVEEMIAEKISEFMDSVQDKRGTILIAGDVADSLAIEKLFYKTLKHALLRYWRRDTKELSEICSKSTGIVLGGIGFSGLNSKFNATMGLYRNAVTAEDDITRSKRFRAVYEKVLCCAELQQVIVLTHTQMNDWSDEKYNPNWIYINGHTHQNSLIRMEDGTTVLSDNQVGYEPKQWHFNTFTVNGRYDPFADWVDRIYLIKSYQYVDFNRGCGISMSDFKHSGNLYVLKRNGVYMFFLKDKRLYMLGGGQKHTAEHDIDYYFNHITLYQQRVKAAFAPYYNALDMISREVCAFGGSGKIHGCIVDIDFFNHIYLNPFDGKVTPYFAWNMSVLTRMLFGCGRMRY